MKTIRIYSDESRQKNERFLLLGGLWIEESNVSVLEKEITALRKKYSYVNDLSKRIDFLGEFKWTKVSDKYINIYKDLVDLFFDAIEKDIARFCVMSVDTQNPIILKYSNIKKEGYFKLLYQLYYHNSKIPAIYKIYPDRITNPTQDKVDFSKLNECLDNAFWSKFIPLLNPNERPGDKGFVNNITSVDSKNCDFIQLVDVVMGGIGYFQNRHFTKENCKSQKRFNEIYYQ